MFLALAIGAFAAEPEDAASRARVLTRAGAIELGGGVAALGSGLVVMLVGRGEPGQISTETQLTSDLRSAGGAALVIGGFTASLVGGSTLGKANVYRARARDLTVRARFTGGGIQVAGTF